MVSEAHCLLDLAKEPGLDHLLTSLATVSLLRGINQMTIE